jgi:hypothetical protein
LIANGNRAQNIARARELLALPTPQKEPETTARSKPDQPGCGIAARCGSRFIKTFARAAAGRSTSQHTIRR